MIMGTPLIVWWVLMEKSDNCFVTAVQLIVGSACFRLLHCLASSFCLFVCLYYWYMLLSLLSPSISSNGGRRQVVGGCICMNCCSWCTTTPFSRGFFHGELLQMQNTFLCIPRNQRDNMAIFWNGFETMNLCATNIYFLSFFDYHKMEDMCFSRCLFYYPVMAVWGDETFK